MSRSTPKNSDNFTPDQLEFLEWLALPKRLRQPKTQKAFAKKIGVHQDTLTDWKRLPNFLDRVVSRSRDLVRQAIPDVLDAVIQQAVTGSIPHVDRVLAMAGMATDVEAAGRGAGGGTTIINNHFAAALDKVYGQPDPEPDEIGLGAALDKVYGDDSESDASPVSG